MASMTMSDFDRECFQQVVKILIDDGEQSKAEYVRGLVYRDEVPLKVFDAVTGFWRAWLVFDERPYDLINERL